jgi:hypothetical protein
MKALLADLLDSLEAGLYLSGFCADRLRLLVTTSGKLLVSLLLSGDA